MNIIQGTLINTGELIQGKLINIGDLTQGTLINTQSLIQGVVEFTDVPLLVENLDFTLDENSQYMVIDLV